MKTSPARPLLLAYYGDDFTGSTDALEALARAGLPCALFLNPPTAAQRARFPALRALGVAGGARAWSPTRMARELPRVFRALKASGALVVHYKTCSTFDSSPTVGSIGKAIELGRRVFGEALTPLVVGAPVLGRYVVFGNLFARSGLDTEPFRLDRHPTMSRHPVTPMHEADLRRHLARQTALPITLVDVLRLEAERAAGTGADLRSRVHGLLAEWATRKPPPVVLFDTLREEHLPVIGRLLASQQPPGGTLFCAGSSGVEYALLAHWRQTGLLSPPVAADSPADSLPGQLIVVSGSCSPVTDRQISLAAHNGFVAVGCDTGRLADRRTSREAVADVLARASAALQAGRSVIFHTARGPEDARRAAFARAARQAVGPTPAAKRAQAGVTLGRGLGRILEAAFRMTGARRAVVCGGDTATAAARWLGIEALEFAGTAAPGAPLCRVHAPGRVVHGCQMIFKGGQVGRDSFFLELVKRESS